MPDAPKTPRSREATRAAWADVLRRFNESGRSVLDFCRAEAIAPQSFYYWKRKLSSPVDAAHAATPATGMPDFLPVRIAPAAPVELALPGGATLRLSPGCDLAFVLSLVQALAGGGAPC
ncbi:MAG: IS66 family insertion sequence element accessory protein TnpA [Limisphaerales bacterium]